jgi:hypothetical protein
MGHEGNADRMSLAKGSCWVHLYGQPWPFMEVASCGSSLATCYMTAAAKTSLFFRFTSEHHVS